MKTGTTETSPATKAIAHETAARAHEQPPNVKQLQAYQLMANNSPRVQAQAQLQAMANRNAATAPKGPGIVQRTAVYISFDPAESPELVPGTAEEDRALFFKALQNKRKYTQKKVEEIIAQMAAPASSEWDKHMAAFLTGDEEEEDDDDGREKEPVSEEEGPAAISDGESSIASSSKKRGTKRARSKSKSRGAKKKAKAKKKAAKAAADISDEDEDAAAPVKANKKAAAGISDEEEEDNDAIPTVETKEDKKGKAAAGLDIEWTTKQVSGKLSYHKGGKKWWVIAGGGYEYGIMNMAAITQKLVDGQRVTYIRPIQDYGPLAKEAGIKDQINKFGVLLTTVAGAPVNKTLPVEQTEGIIALQEAGREAGEKHAAKKASGLTTYRPSLQEEKYAVKWGQPPLRIEGTADDRTMVRTMDINYQPPGDDAEALALPGESVHRDELFEQETLHGNGINARFSLVYLEGGELNLAPGEDLPFGSGRTTSSAAEKHSNANRIATMLVESGQIGSVNEYNDGKHSHSEQAMIVYLSKHLNVFDAQLASLKSKKVSIVALVLDMYSNPNTVCEHCHASLNTFFTTTDWKARITARLAAKAGRRVEIGAPDVIIRVSSNKAFSASANAAIPKAKASHTVTQGEHDINFIERVPFNKSHY
jgi:hypothetical protein